MKRTEWSILAICCFGFLLRVGYMTFFIPDLTFPDEERIFETAVNILSNGQMEWGRFRAWDMPLMPLLTAFGLLVGDGNIYAVKLILVLLSSATIYLVARITGLITDSRRAPVIAAILTAIYPFFVFFSGLVLTETLFLFFFALSLSLLFNNSNYATLLTGVSSALAQLTRPTILYFMPVIWIWQLWLQHIPLRKVIVGAVLFCCLVSVWGARNYLVLGEFMFITSNSGQVLWEGNNPWNKTGGTSGDFSDKDAYLEPFPDSLGEIELDRAKRSKAIEYILTHPGNTVRLALLKFKRFWSITPNSRQHQDAYLKIISILSFGPILVCALVTAFTSRDCFKNYSVFYAFVGYYTLLHMITIGSLRYRLPVDLVLIILASISLGRLYDWAFCKTQNPRIR